MANMKVYMCERKKGQQIHEMGISKGNDVEKSTSDMIAKTNKERFITANQ